MKKLIDMLEQYCQEYLPMHMPGHKRNAYLAEYLNKLNAAIDITEVQGFDNLQNPQGILKASMEAASEYYASKRSFYLVNGSTVGILAGIFALASDNDTVLLARNSHISVFHGAVLRNLNIEFAEPEYIDEFNIAGSVTADTIKKAFIKNPDISLVIITSPSYEGVISDIKSIADIAHSFGAKLLVDEAHGAHLYRNGFFKGGAVNAGADIVVQSLHKTLPSLTQTAIAHVQNEAYTESFARWLNVFQTTSPSYLLLSSIDGCINFLRENGEKQFKIWEEAINAFDSAIKPLKNLNVFCHGAKDEKVFLYDKSKILISSAKSDISGYDLFNKLRKDFHIEAEMASSNLCLCMTGMGDNNKTLSALAEALLKIDEKLKTNTEPPKTLNLPSVLMQIPTSAGVNADYKEADLNKACGMVCAETVYAYPPGVPVAVPGCAITEETVVFIKNAINTGCNLQHSKSKCIGKIAVCI